MTEPLKPAPAADRAAIPLRDAAAARERGWWRRVPRMLWAPREVLVALREDDEEDVVARAEPVLALVILAGIGAILLTPEWGSLLDDWRIDTTVAAVFTFLGGGMYGAVGYFLLGLVVYVGARGMGGELSFRQSRQAIAFAAAPLALFAPIGILAIVLLAGEDYFHEFLHGTGETAIRVIGAAFGLWAAALVVAGLRITHRLAWLGVAGAVLLAAVVVAAFAVLPGVL